MRIITDTQVNAAREAIQCGDAGKLRKDKDWNRAHNRGPTVATEHVARDTIPELSKVAPDAGEQLPLADPQSQAAPVQRVSKKALRKQQRQAARQQTGAQAKKTKKDTVDYTVEHAFRLARSGTVDELRKAVTHLTDHMENPQKWRDEKGRQIIYPAVQSGDIEKVRYLVEEAGIPPVPPDSHGTNTIQIAIQKGATNIAKYLRMKADQGSR